MLRRVAGTAACCAPGAGCAVGPNYHRPDTAVDAHFANAGEPGLAENDAVEQYWIGFADPLLDRLDRRCARPQQGPDHRGGESAGRARHRDDWPDSINIRPSIWRPVTPTISIRRNNCPASIMHDREFDVAQAGFRRVVGTGFVRASEAQSVEAARADVGASAATLQDARVSVIAEVARDYFILRGLQDQLALTQRNADNQFNSLKLTRNRLEAGRGNELDTSRAEAQWQTTLSSIPTLGGVDCHHHLPIERADRTAADRALGGLVPAGPVAGAAAAKRNRHVRNNCCGADRTCAWRNGTWPQPPRESAWRWAICFPR